MKNVGRQPYTVADANLNVYKAESLARRFNYSLGLDIAWYKRTVLCRKARQPVQPGLRRGR